MGLHPAAAEACRRVQAAADAPRGRRRRRPKLKRQQQHLPPFDLLQDRIVAVRRAWPSGEEEGYDELFEPPPGAIRRSSSGRLSGALQAVTPGARRQQGEQRCACQGGCRRQLGLPPPGPLQMLQPWRAPHPPSCFASLPPRRRPCYCLFAAFDGHNGSEAARFAAHTIVPILEAFLPARQAPAGAAATFPTHQGPGELQGQLQAALVETLLELQRQFAMAGLMGGCTATLVLQVGGLCRPWVWVGGQPWQEQQAVEVPRPPDMQALPESRSLNPRSPLTPPPSFRRRRCRLGCW